jgi:hypothetical protein
MYDTVETAQAVLDQIMHGQHMGGVPAEELVAALNAVTIALIMG